MSSYSQNISGLWHWNSANGENSFEINIYYFDGTQIKASHCSSFYSGKKIDCTFGEDNICSVFMNKVSINKFEGTIESAFSNSTGKIRLTYSPENNTLKFELLESPPLEYYLPKNIILEK